MLKLALATSALAVAGTTVYLTRASHDDPAAPPAHAAAAAATAPARVLHYGAGAPHVPSLAAAAAAPAVAARAATADDLPYLPADADAVIGIDLAKLRDGALWQQFVAPALALAPAMPWSGSGCSFDPIASVSSISIGLRGFGNDQLLSGTIVIHGLDRAKALACAGAQHVDGGTLRIDDGVVLFTTPGGYHVGAAFPDATTAVVVLGPDAATRAGVVTVAQGGGGLDASPGFAALFGNVDATDPVWLVVTERSPLLGEINRDLASSSGIQLRGAYGSIAATDALSLHGGIRLASAAVAAQLVATAQHQLDELAANGPTSAYFDQLDVVSDGTDVLLDATLTAAQLIGIARAGTVDVNVEVEASSGSAGS